MQKIIHQRIEKNIRDSINKKCKEYKIGSISPALEKSIKEYSLRKGKRIRPLLFILSYQGYRNSNQKLSESIYNVSTAIEFLHNFMLIHDDIIDDSHLRRGRPTMHKLLETAAKANDKESLGKNLAIITGDILYTFAIEVFLGIDENYKRKEKALDYFLQTTTITAIGEFIDTLQGYEQLQKIKEKDVFLNYSLKTARYTFTSPMVIGAILSGAKDKEIQKITQLGEKIGQAFQIQDDVIGIFGTQERIGKSILSDIEESKKTLLVCHAYHNMNAKEKKDFKAIFNKKRKTFKDLQRIRKIFLSSGSLRYCICQIETRYNETITLLQKTRMKAPYPEMILDNIQKLFDHTQRLAKAYKIPLHLNKS